MKEEIVTFETAKLLKACGFPQEPCLEIDYWYDEQECKLSYNTAKLMPGDIYAAPTQALAMRWLNEVKDIQTYPIFDPYDELWGFQLYALGPYNIGVDEPSTLFDTYEQAAEEGLRAACHHLLTQKKGE